jgi:hypothetical protein
VYLLSLWSITGAIASAAINKMLARRIRTLQVGCFVLDFFVLGSGAVMVVLGGEGCWCDL